MQQYDQIGEEFGFTTIDATRNVHDQQQRVRQIIGKGIDLARYRSRVSRRP
jgi:thymidylate kinase